jgi:tRNA pseudouridine13 synthase
VNLPYLSADHSPIHGVLRTTFEDFRVDEVPAYDPEGQGTHLFVRFEKTDFTTAEAVKRIARALGCDPKAAGFAGVKDRRAVTTQWASFEAASPEAALALELDGIRIHHAVRHSTKLRTGHLRANRFTLVVREVPEARDDDFRAIASRLAREGMPNYFGEQRFGRDGDNVARAIAWLSGETRAPREHFERKMLASALQSEFFNRVVSQRVASGELSRVRHGDLCRKEETGGLFVAEDVAVEQPRADAGIISPTGPMFGPEMRWPLHEAEASERAVLEASGLSAEVLGRLGKQAPGTRRTVRVFPTDVEIARVEAGLEVAFTLPSGAYATCFMREILKDDADNSAVSGDAPSA